MSKISEELLGRYLSSECTDSELAEIKHWIEECPENARLLLELERTDALAREGLGRRGLDSETSKAFTKLNRRIIVHDELRQERRRRSWIWGGVAAAAVVGLIITVAAGFLFRQKTEMVTLTAAANPVETTLPDGTRVWLNKYTSIVYPEDFMESRYVRLDGEAYFEVTHDKEHPFTVDGNYIDVTVLGTKFTFRSSRGDAFSFVSLDEGSVKVKEMEGDECFVLKPGQKALYDPKQGLLTVSDANTALDAVWINNNIPFKNASIREIAGALEQLYGTKVNVDPRVSTNATYSGAAMKYDSLDTTLNMLSNTLPISYTIHNGEVWISARE